MPSRRPKQRANCKSRPIERPRDELFPDDGRPHETEGGDSREHPGPVGMRSDRLSVETQAEPEEGVSLSAGGLSDGKGMQDGTETRFPPGGRASETCAVAHNESQVHAMLRSGVDENG